MKGKAIFSHHTHSLVYFWVFEPVGHPSCGVRLYLIVESRRPGNLSRPACHTVRAQEDKANEKSSSGFINLGGSLILKQPICNKPAAQWDQSLFILFADKQQEVDIATLRAAQADSSVSPSGRSKDGAGAPSTSGTTVSNRHQHHPKLATSSGNEVVPVMEDASEC